MLILLGSQGTKNRSTYICGTSTPKALFSASFELSATHAIDHTSIWSTPTDRQTPPAISYRLNILDLNKQTSPAPSFSLFQVYLTDVDEKQPGQSCLFSNIKKHFFLFFRAVLFVLIPYTQRVCVCFGG